MQVWGYFVFLKAKSPPRSMKFPSLVWFWFPFRQRCREVCRQSPAFNQCIVLYGCACGSSCWCWRCCRSVGACCCSTCCCCCCCSTPSLLFWLRWLLFDSLDTDISAVAGVVSDFQGFCSEFAVPDILSLWMFYRLREAHNWVASAILALLAWLSRRSIQRNRFLNWVGEKFI